MAIYPITTVSAGVSLVSFPSVGSSPVQPGAVFGKLRLPTDPVGITTVTFDGVVAGSEIRVYDPDLNELAGVESCTANHVLTWPVYAAGSSNNNVQIKIINTAYRIKDFPYTSKVGNQSIPVQMEPDKWFSNP